MGGGCFFIFFFFGDEDERLDDDTTLCEIRRFQELRSDGIDGEIGGDGVESGEAPDRTELSLSEERSGISFLCTGATISKESPESLERPIS